MTERSGGTGVLGPGTAIGDIDTRRRDSDLHRHFVNVHTSNFVGIAIVVNKHNILTSNYSFTVISPLDIISSRDPQQPLKGGAKMNAITGMNRRKYFSLVINSPKISPRGKYRCEITCKQMLTA